MDVSWVMTTEIDIKQCKELLSHFIETIIQETIKSAWFLMESQWFREEIIHSTNKQKFKNEENLPGCISRSHLSSAIKPPSPEHSQRESSQKLTTGLSNEADIVDSAQAGPRPVHLDGSTREALSE